LGAENNLQNKGSPVAEKSSFDIGYCKKSISQVSNYDIL